MSLLKNHPDTLASGSGLSVAGLAPLALHSVQAVNVYRDTDGATPGASSGGGTWDANKTAGWTTDSTGSIATTTYGAAGGDATADVFFAAGTDATGSYTLTITGAVVANSITIEWACSFAGASTPSPTLGAGGLTLFSTASGASSTAASLTPMLLSAS